MKWISKIQKNVPDFWESEQFDTDLGFQISTFNPNLGGYKKKYDVARLEVIYDSRGEQEEKSGLTCRSWNHEWNRFHVPGRHKNAI
jgi:hypothetical protein